MKLTMTTARSHTPVTMVSTDVSSRKSGLLEELCMQESSVQLLIRLGPQLISGTLVGVDVFVCLVMNMHVNKCCV